ncbi:MAG: hypothetical protein IKF72_02090 [Kiritimatiellae bacterium]|nr:hypothetical protein [Kiritimatiellia bacterium]
MLLAIEQNTHNIKASVLKAGYLRIQNSGGVNATAIVGKYSVYDENIPNRGTAWNPNFDDARTVATSDSGAVRFGTTENALTKLQLERLRHGKVRVKLDANGYLHDAIMGMCISFR